MYRNFTNDENPEGADEPGSFSWNLDTNTLYGDSSVARLYGLDADDVLRGLPLQAYVDKIHSADRAPVAEAIHSAIITGEAYNARFRIVADNMTTVSVMAFGRCYRDAAGIPTIFSGIVFSSDAVSPANTLLGQVIAAHTSALEEGDVEVAHALDALVRRLAVRHRGTGSYASH